MVVFGIIGGWSFMHSNSTVFSLIMIKGVPNMKKHLRNLSQYWDQNRTQMKLLQQVITSPVVTLSLIRYNSFSRSNFYFVMPVSWSRKKLGQFICCFPIIHASPCCFLDIIQSESIHFPSFFSTDTIWALCSWRCPGSRIRRFQGN